jgi:hypothetical protein
VSLIAWFRKPSSSSNIWNVFFCDKWFVARTDTGALSMKVPVAGEALFDVQAKSSHWRQLIYRRCTVLLFLTTQLISQAQTQQQAKLPGSNPVPEPAVSAIIAAYDKYEVVGMGAAHGEKDQDDFILSLIRNLSFLQKVNDIAVECGNSLYQPILDRYIAGEEVPFTEVQKVWRNTTQEMCDWSGFYEQFFPLMRAINQKLPSEKRLRVLAADPPIDWDLFKTGHRNKFLSRDETIASVMEKEVLSKHRKALMLFGDFHLTHGTERSAVSLYEKDYPNLTFVISELGFFDTDLPDLSRSSRFATWPFPTLARAKGTWLGALGLGDLYPKSVSIDKDCNLHTVEFPKDEQKPMEELFDAFFYLGPQDLRLNEPMPADIALDTDYRVEVERRKALPNFPGPGTDEALKKSDREIVSSAANPIQVIPKGDVKSWMGGAVQTCLDRKKHSNPSQ